MPVNATFHFQRTKECPPITFHVKDNHLTAQQCFRRMLKEEGGSLADRFHRANPNSVITFLHSFNTDIRYSVIQQKKEVFIELYTKDADSEYDFQETWSSTVKTLDEFLGSQPKNLVLTSTY